MRALRTNPGSARWCAEGDVRPSAASVHHPTVAEPTLGRHSPRPPPTRARDTRTRRGRWCWRLAASPSRDYRRRVDPVATEAAGAFARAGPRRCPPTGGVIAIRRGAREDGVACLETLHCMPAGQMTRVEGPPRSPLQRARHGPRHCIGARGGVRPQGVFHDQIYAPRDKLSASVHGSKLGCRGWCGDVESPPAAEQFGGGRP
jgi:hypothetical protein